MDDKDFAAALQLRYDLGVRVVIAQKALDQMNKELDTVITAVTAEVHRRAEAGEAQPVVQITTAS